MNDPVITVENLGKCYPVYKSNIDRFANWFGMSIRPNEEYWAIKDINFRLNAGEALALVGQNGAGKSTLLKVITGTVRPTEGAVQIKGSVSAILELGLGFNPEFTGRQNIYQAGGLMGISKEKLHALIPDIQSFSELGDFFDKPIRVYSSGMHARLAFSLATAIRPDVLIVDEVLSVGDAFFQAKCFDRISSFRKQGTSLLFVTHSMGDVVKHCDRAVFIEKGKVQFDGDTRQACNLYYDSLFGKKKVPTIEARSDLEAGLSLSKSEDVFCTRPNYRKEEHRWGQGGARILDYNVKSENQSYPPSIESGSMVDFSFSVLFDDDYPDVTPGVLLKSHDGLFIYGTNSFLSGKGMTVSARKDELKVFKFSMPINLNGGHYLLSFGVSSGPQENLIPLDRRYDSVLITVDRPMPFWGIFDLQANFEALGPITHDK
ncbi:ABC transporter ATP-binding protein [Brucella anthropi]|uniref:ABC transporter ATP-binding protein n=1 Tax=Brucella anthropi TaxID=529 RepID=UPI003987232F